MKQRLILTIFLCFNFSITKTSNPLDKACGGRTGSVEAAAFHGQMGLGKIKWKGKHYSWTQVIQGGFFFNALYLRILLSEFYCARCAIGASPFASSDLAQQANPASFPDLTSGNQPKSPGLLPGGFDATTVNAFINKAKNYAAQLRTVRKLLEPANDYSNNAPFTMNKSSGNTPAPNPLTTFAGIIIVPTKQFVSSLGPINVENGQIFTQPRFFPYQNPIGTPSVTSSSSASNVITTPNAVASTTNGSNTDPTSLTMSLNAALKEHPQSSKFCIISMTSWDKSATLNSQPLPLRLKSLNMGVLGTNLNLTIYDGYNTLTSDQIALANFFKYAVHNPWAIVIEIDGNLENQKINTTATIKAFVHLNPLEFSAIPNLNTLINMPNNLYYSIQNTNDGLSVSQQSQRTPTARLLRGIANGYLTSWKYNPLASGSNNSHLSDWEDAYNAVSYPTPSTSQFQNNSDNYMFYALFGCRSALSQMYIQQKAIASISSIIANPTKSIPGYVGASKVGITGSVATATLGYNPVTTVIQNFANPRASSQQTSKPKPKTNKKTKSPKSIKQPKPAPKQKPNQFTDSASVKAYKKGYQDGLASTQNKPRRPRRMGNASIKAYKAGYQDGFTAVQYGE